MDVTLMGNPAFCAFPCIRMMNIFDIKNMSLECFLALFQRKQWKKVMTYCASHIITKCYFS